MPVSCLKSAVHWATSLLSANLHYRACILYLLMSSTHGVAGSLDCVEIILVRFIRLWFCCPFSIYVHIFASNVLLKPLGVNIVGQFARKSG